MSTVMSATDLATFAERGWWISPVLFTAEEVAAVRREMLRAKRGWSVGIAWTLAGIVIATAGYFAWRDGSAYLARFVPKSWEQRLGAHI